MCELADLRQELRFIKGDAVGRVPFRVQDSRQVVHRHDGRQSCTDRKEVRLVLEIYPPWMKRVPGLSLNHRPPAPAKWDAKRSPQQTSPDGGAGVGRVCRLWPATEPGPHAGECRV